MSNLYEILEVSEKASKEVIEKAYRVLAKKYHPDLQSVEEEKKNAESKMKQINEAYEVLSNEEKRKEYDLTLQQEREEQKRKEKIEEQRQRNQEDNREIEYVRKTNNNTVEEMKEQIRKKQEGYQNIQKLKNDMNRAYTQAYHNYLRSLRL